MYCYGRDGKPQPHPQLIRVTLDDDQEPYAKGDYILCPSSIYIDRFGQPAIRARLRSQVARQGGMTMGPVAIGLGLGMVISMIRNTAFRRACPF